jgi:hypothetical protein
MQSLSSNYYACLSPPPCQSKEYESNINPTTTSHIDPETTIPLANANNIPRRWARKLSQRQQSHPDLTNKIDTAANITDVAPPPWRYVISNDDNLLCRGMEDGTIPSTVVDSGCTLGVGTTDDPCWRTGRTSIKQFVLPGGRIVKATKIAEYPFKVRSPAQELHITPGITENSLLSTSKFAAANYITIFNKEEVNIYDANDTIIAVTRGTILRGFKCPMTGMWCIPLVDLVWNNNTETVIVNCPQSEFLPARPPPTKAIHNIYEIKTQPELVRYYHAAAGFPTKPTWL